MTLAGIRPNVVLLSPRNTSTSSCCMGGWLCLKFLIAGGLRLLSLSEQTHAGPSAPVGTPLNLFLRLPHE